MPVTFARTLRSLEQDRPRRLLWLIVFVVAAWAGWMLVAQIPVYETTRQARIEVSRAAYPIASLVDGRVAWSRLGLGDHVESGQTVVQLDATSAELAKSEGLAKITALEGRRAAFAREIAAERETLESLRLAREKAATELDAQVARAGIVLKLAAVEATRLRQLYERKAVSESELQTVESKVAEYTASLTESKANMERTQLDRLTAQSECNTRIIRLQRTENEVEGELRIEQAGIARYEQEIKDRIIVAPVSGRLDEVGPLRTGSVVTAAQKLAVVIPLGEPQVVASFPVVVVGRIQKGQSARLRLDGFPWTQYGTVPAEVTEVGTEPVDGRIRVELTLQPDSDSGVPIEHGLTGSVEIEVERASPAVLVLRAAGQFLGPQGRRETIPTENADITEFANSIER